MSPCLEIKSLTIPQRPVQVCNRWRGNRLVDLARLWSKSLTFPPADKASPRHSSLQAWTGLSDIQSETLDVQIVGCTLHLYDRSGEASTACSIRWSFAWVRLLDSLGLPSSTSWLSRLVVDLRTLIPFAACALPSLDLAVYGHCGLGNRCRCFEVSGDFAC